MTAIESRLQELLLKQARTLDVEPDEAPAWNLDAKIETHGLNSMAMLALIRAINSEFDVNIIPGEGPELTTLRDLVDYLESHSKSSSTT